MSIYQFIAQYQCISIIGMEKNTGKTETLNKIIQDIGSNKILGLNSIGRDGEEVDVVSNTSKPRIYVFKNTIIATARQCLVACDITKEILFCTGISTPLGEIIIVRALSDGYIDLAGGSHNAQNIFITEKMKEFGCDHILIDGALNRNSSAIISEAVILTTGASVSSDISTAVNRTSQLVDMLQLPTISQDLQTTFLHFFENYSLGIINNNDELIPIEVVGIMAIQNAIKEYLTIDTKSILIKSAITDSFIENIIKHRKNFEKIECVIMDGTKCFISYDNYRKALACGVIFKVINPINLVLLSYNPYSPKGEYYFDNVTFKNMLQDSVSIPIINTRDSYEIDKQ